MKIKIESDTFDIVERIKDIDENYFLLFDLEKEKFELHNKSQANSYCFTYPYDNLDNRMLNLIYKSSVGFIDKIMEDIDRNNCKIERNNMEKVKSDADYMFREIYNFSNNSSKELDDNKAFSSVWR